MKRRPSQSVDSRPSTTTTTTTTVNTATIPGRLQDDDIFDNEVSTSSPPVKVFWGNYYFFKVFLL